MRTIMGFCGNCTDITMFTKGLMQAAPFGPADSRIVDLGCGLLGYHRRASVDRPADEMQPLSLDGSYAVCSGNFTGYGSLRAGLQARGYTFRSRCDCELLLPLYREYGVEMFKRLSGQFIAARDSSGGRPLYYGCTDTGDVVFASEPESLTGLCARVLPFPPGHYYMNGQFVRYDDNADVA